MEKVLAMFVAAQLTQASAGNASAGDHLPISPEITDPGVRAKNLMVWESFRIFYHAVVKALADDNPETGWPPPRISLSGWLDVEKLAAVAGRLLGGAPVALPGGVSRLPDPGK